MDDLPYAEEIRIYCKEVLEKLCPRAVILYGSMATGSYGIGSDIDMIVISEKLPKNFLERLSILFELNSTTAPIEPLGYTPKEFLEMITRRHPTALYAVADGKALYDDGFLPKQKECLRPSGKNLGWLGLNTGGRQGR
jgi:predicted nucleotidyltransferase